MFAIPRFLGLLSRKPVQGKLNKYFQARNFLSQAYYCEEVWDNRLNNPIIKKANPDELYHELEQRYGKSKTISAVDVDIFANCIKSEDFVDELIDLVHKLRLSADSSNTLDSTHHALVRCLSKFRRNEDLVNILDDRLNFGIFLDDYTASLLLDKYWKDKDFISGARLAGQLMLQEDFNHPIVASLSLLHCYHYLKQENREWPETEKPAEPEEDLKVRVRYLRNEFFDNHFDLRSKEKIIGKTLILLGRELNKKKPNLTYKSFEVLGMILFGDIPLIEQYLNKTTDLKIYKEILNLAGLGEDLNPDLKNLLNKFELVDSTEDIFEFLEKEVQKAERSIAEKDVAKQCELFSKWEQDRKTALEEQETEVLRIQRLAKIEDLQKDLKAKETKLWFFENEQQIELAIEGKSVYHPKRWFGKKKKPRKIDEGYIPPEVGAR